MKRQRTINELKNSDYICKAEIERLFGVSQGEAVKIYNHARRLDEQELREWLVCTTKVRTDSVYRVQKIKRPAREPARERNETYEKNH